MPFSETEGLKVTRRRFIGYNVILEVVDQEEVKIGELLKSPSFNPFFSGSCSLIYLIRKFIQGITGKTALWHGKKAILDAIQVVPEKFNLSISLLYDP